MAENNKNTVDTVYQEVALADLCQILGISLSTGRRLSQSGVFKHSSVKGKAGTKYYQLAPCVQAYLQKKQAEYDEKNNKTDIEELKTEKLKAEISLKESQGELHLLKTEIAKGNYISTADVALDYQRFFVLFKKFAMAIPARVGGYIAGYVDPVVERGIEKDIQREICSMLRNFVVAGHTPPEEGGTK